MKLAIARLCVATLVAVAAVVGLELALRALAPEGFLEEPYRMWMVRDPFTGWRNQPGFDGGAFRIDSLGFRGPEVTVEKPAGTLRIVCLGDSGTFGLWHAESADGPHRIATRFDASYPEELARALADHRPPVQVVNAGLVASTSSHGLRMLISRVLDLQPDIVTVRYLWNDHEPAFEPALRADDPDTELGRWLLETFRHWQLLRLGLRAYQGLDVLHPEPESVRWVTLERYESNLHRFAEIARAHGFHLLFIDYPLRPASWGTFPSDDKIVETGHYGSVRELRVTHEQYRAVLRRVADEDGVPLVDANAELSRRRPPAYTTVDIVHPNETGARILGDAIAASLRDLGWLQGGGAAAQRAEGERSRED